MYVTVRVTTCLMLTALGIPDRGGSPKNRVLPSRYQLVGEYGERSVLLRGVALRGVALLDMELMLALRGDSPPIEE